MIMGAIMSVFLLLTGFFVVQNQEATHRVDTNVQEKNTQAHSNPAHSSSNQTSATGSWGSSPFGSGQTVALHSQPANTHFQKSNLEWKSRTIQLKDGRSVTYEFGKGNPSEVALTTDQIKVAYKSCSGGIDGEFCSEDSGYISPEVESNLLAALGDPNWQTLLEKCSQQLKVQEPFNDSRNKGVLTYAQVFSPEYREIEKWITVDITTGRKALNIDRVSHLYKWLYVSTDVVQKAYSGTDSALQITSDCVDVYGKEILRRLLVAETYYRRPPGVF